MPIRMQMMTTKMTCLLTWVLTTSFLLVISVMDDCCSHTWEFTLESFQETLYSSEGPLSLIKPGDGEAMGDLLWSLSLNAIYFLLSM